MIKSRLTVCILLASCLSVFLHKPAAVFAMSWKEKDSDHFICYYTTDDKFAKQTLDKAEDYYKQIALDLGYPRYTDFWTYDNRAKIFIYPDHASYLKAADMPEWSHGMADYNKKEIVSYLWSGEFLDSILPHETAHLIFRDFVGFTGEIPLWLDEGVAQWSETCKRSEMKGMVYQLYEEDRLLSLEDLMKLDVRKLKKMDRVYIRATRDKEGKPAALFLSTDALITNYYLVAVSVIGFLIERYGSDRFSRFCRELRDGKEVGEALKFAYSPSIQSIEDLEVNWRQYLAEM